MVGHFLSRCTNKRTVLVECNPEAWHFSSRFTSLFSKTEIAPEYFSLGNVFIFMELFLWILALTDFWLSDSKSVS